MTGMEEEVDGVSPKWISSSGLMRGIYTMPQHRYTPLPAFKETEVEIGSHKDELT